MIFELKHLSQAGRSASEAIEQAEAMMNELMASEAFDHSFRVVSVCLEQKPSVTLCHIFFVEGKDGYRQIMQSVTETKR